MLSPNTILKDQLKKIIANMNKKHSVLRKQIIKVSEVFQKQNLPIFPYQVCFGLLRQVGQAGSLSTGMLFLSFLQQIITLGFATSDMTRQIVYLLIQIKALPKFRMIQNQIKLQQIILLLVSRNSLSLTNIQTTYSIFNILFGFDNAHNKTLWSKTLTIYSQIVMIFLVQISQNKKQSNINIFKQFILDLNKLSRGQHIKWMIQSGDQFLFLALISQILQQKLFIEQKLIFTQIFLQILASNRKLFLKLHQNVINYLPGSPTKIWQLSVQSKLMLCLKVICRISRLFCKGFQILQQIIKLIGQKSFLKIIGYQSINYLFACPIWTHQMLLSCSGDLFNFLLTTLFNNLKNLQHQLKQGYQYRLIQPQKSKIFTNNSLQLSVGDWSSSVQARYIIRSVEEITLSLQSVYQMFYNIKFHSKIEGKPPLQKIYKFVHKTVFQVVKAVIGRQISQQTLQGTLKIAERVINLAGLFSDAQTTAIFVKLLCRHSLPTGNKQISQRHVQITKMILSAANCLGGIVGVIQNYLL